MLSVSIKPHIVVDVVTVWDKPLKHVVDVLICDDRQCGVQASTKLARIIPTRHWIVRVETIFLTVHRVAFVEGRYDIYDVQQNQHTACRIFAHTVTCKYVIPVGLLGLSFTVILPTILHVLWVNDFCLICCCNSIPTEECFILLSLFLTYYLNKKLSYRRERARGYTAYTLRAIPAWTV